jgi:YVTN family beta-propeller protein
VSSHDRVYAANQTSNTVSVIDPSNNKLLGVIRVYTKAPGKPADYNSPFTLPLGSMVEDLAAKVHQDLAEKLLHLELPDALGKREAHLILKPGVGVNAVPFMCHVLVL